ncbi:MAG: DUF3006 domain-containing protein [Chloroflexi bacterium]|nr:DUF3006 domain-containing protein [Chloroflexota bacterium]
MKAVIDRFEGDYAILVIGEEERQINVLRSLLPKEAKEGHWLSLDIVGGEPHNIVIDEHETDQVKKRIADKMAALRRGPETG